MVLVQATRDSNRRDLGGHTRFVESITYIRIDAVVAGARSSHASLWPQQSSSPYPQLRLESHVHCSIWERRPAEPLQKQKQKERPKKVGEPFVTVPDHTPHSCLLESLSLVHSSLDTNLIPFYFHTPPSLPQDARIDTTWSCHIAPAPRHPSSLHCTAKRSSATSITLRILLGFSQTIWSMLQNPSTLNPTFPFSSIQARSHLRMFSSSAIMAPSLIFGWKTIGSTLESNMAFKIARVDLPLLSGRPWTCTTSWQSGPKPPSQLRFR